MPREFYTFCPQCHRKIDVLDEVAYSLELAGAETVPNQCRIRVYCGGCGKYTILLSVEPNGADFLSRVEKMVNEVQSQLA